MDVVDRRMKRGKVVGGGELRLICNVRRYDRKKEWCAFDGCNLPSCVVWKVDFVVDERDGGAG